MRIHEQKTCYKCDELEFQINNLKTIIKDLQHENSRLIVEIQNVTLRLMAAVSGSEDPLPEARL